MEEDDEAERLRAMLRAHAPAWAEAALHPLEGGGTDNALFRLGPAHLLRLPRRAEAAPLLTKELDWLPRLAPLPLAVPAPLARGPSALPAGGEFGIFAWIAGEAAAPSRLDDPHAAARALRKFLTALRARPVAGAPRAGAANHRRGVALPALDAAVRPAIATLADEVDALRALALWEAALAARPCAAPAWLHGDLKDDNLLARDGRLVAVLDWGLAAVGDPSADDAAAWGWVDPGARNAFLDGLGADAVRRAAGWALYGAVIALSWYRHRGNPALCAWCRRTLGRLGLLR